MMNLGFNLTINAPEPASRVGVPLLKAHMISCHSSAFRGPY